MSQKIINSFQSRLTKREREKLNRFINLHMSDANILRSRCDAYQSRQQLEKILVQIGIKIKSNRRLTITKCNSIICVSHLANRKADSAKTATTIPSRKDSRQDTTVFALRFSNKEIMLKSSTVTKKLPDLHLQITETMNSFIMLMFDFRILTRTWLSPGSS